MRSPPSATSLVRSVVDVTEKGEVTSVFGVESHGAYAEAFDSATGKVKFRFCTCYWFHNCEAWGLK